MELLSQPTRRRHGVPAADEELERHVTATTTYLDALDDIFYVCNEAGELQRWNEQLTRLTGYSDEILASMTIQECVSESEADRVDRALVEALETGNSRYEATLVTETGETQRVEFTATACDEADTPGRIAGVGRVVDPDDDEAGTRDPAAFGRDTKYRQLTERISDGFYALDDDWRITYWNETIAERQEISEAEALGENFWELFSSVCGTVVEEKYRQAMETQESVSFEYYYEPLEYWVQVRAYPSEEGISVYSTEITERKEHEVELERARDRLEQAERLADLGAWEIDVREQPHEVWWSDEVARIHEIPVDSEPTLDEVIDLHHPEDRSRIRTVIEEAIDEGEGFDIETRLELDEETRWVRSVGEPVIEDGTTEAIRGSVQEITQRQERERDLERSRDLLRHTEQLARTGGWEVDAETHQQRWTDGTYAIHDLDPESDLDPSVSDGLSFYHPDDRDEIERAILDCLNDGKPFEQDLRLRTTEDRLRWVRAAGKAIQVDGETDYVRGAIQDITEQKQRELALESLHEATQGLLGVETEPEVASLVSEIAEDVLDVTGAGVYLLDDDEGVLYPTGVSQSYESLTDGASAVSIGDADGALSSAYLSGDSTLLTGVAESCSECWIDDETGGVIVPIGEHGVFVAVTGDEAIDHSTRQLVETLVGTTEAVLDRLESEATVQERDAVLEARNRRLERQVQINEIIRSIDQSLLRANTRDAIMVAVCDQVVEADWIEFAWIGVDTPGEPPLEPQAWSGKNPTYLDTITLDGTGPSTEPAWQTASSGESTIVETVLEEVQSEGWRKQALSSGYQSVLSVPLAYDEYAYGVLTVYASETDAFGDLERRVFEELGENIASSINSAETRQALHTDTTLEVQLQFEHPGRVLDNIARTGDCTVTYQSHATETTGQSRLFFTADDAETETLDAVLDDLHAVESYSLVNEDSSSQLFVATVTGSLLVEHLVRHGGKPRSVVATPEATVATVDLPLEVDVREYVEMLTEQFGPVELDSRRTVERELQTPTGHRSTLFGTLTERQLEVLRTAYFGGFFEWPRESTGEEIAELLDVSQPTVNRHLRLGQQALLSELFSG